MFSRYFSTLCAFILFVAIVSSNATSNATEEPSQSRVAKGDQIRNPGIAITKHGLREAFKWAAKQCLKEAGHNCKQHWKHPKTFINCAGRFLYTNKGRCAVGQQPVPANVYTNLVNKLNDTFSQ